MNLSSRLAVFPLLALALAGLSVAQAFAGDSFTQAVMLFGDKKYGDSEKLLLQHLATNPKNAEAHYYLASCLHREGKLAEASREYQLIIKSFPGTQAATYASQALSALTAAPAAPAAPASPASPESSVAGAAGGEKNPFEVKQHSDKDEIPDQDWIPYSKYVGGNLMVKASINGRPLEMTFDTGAEGTIVSLKNWQSMGFARPTGPIAGYSNGIGGRIAMWAEEVEVCVGKIKKHIVINVAEKLNSEPLLGESFFGDFQYNIDNSKGYIHFFRKGHNSAASAIPYNSIDIPFRNVGANMVVTGKVNGHEQEFYFDTGANSIHFSLSHLFALGLSIPPGAAQGYVSGVAGRNRAWFFTVDRIEVGDLRKTNMMVVVSADSIAYPLLGQTFFGDRKYVIDNDRKLIRFVR